MLPPALKKNRKQNQTHIISISVQEPFIFLYQRWVERLKQLQQSIPQRNHQGQLLKVEHDVGVGDGRRGGRIWLFADRKLEDGRRQRTRGYYCKPLRTVKKGNWRVSFFFFVLKRSTEPFLFFFLLPWDGSSGNEIQPTLVKCIKNRKMDSSDHLDTFFIFY